jgi:hypothetical protein
MSLRLEFTCSYCMKIYRKPVILPCNHCLCEEHLKDIDVLKVKKIQCKTCKQEFGINENEFKPNEIAQNLIEKEMHLTEVEKTLKNLCEKSLKEVIRLNDEHENDKQSLILKCYEHFQEIRRKIDLQREELKDEIDKIALAMIDRTKDFELLFMKQLEPQDEITLEEREGYEKLASEKFRDPEALLQFETTSVENYQSEINEEIEAVKVWLKEFDEMTNHFFATNSFQPNLTFSKDSFGRLNLSGYYSLNASKILSIKQEYTNDLMRLCEFPSDANKWSLLYRGSMDGFRAKDFHLKCDNESSTLTIIKVNGSDFIFGGYTEAEWQSSGI